MGLSTTHLLILLAIVLLLFGAGRISSLMGEFAKGIKSFKKGLAEDEDPAKTPGEAPKAIEAQAKSAERAPETQKAS
jgi:sec-independent protein translocase protein TatA